MSRSRQDWNVNRDEHRDAIRRANARFGPCPTCNAIAGNPCRNRDLGGWALMSNPHAGRPLREVKS